MFVGSPPGNYDRILDFSTAVTGCLFFVPSQTLLDGLADDDDDGAADEAAASAGSGPATPPLAHQLQTQPAQPASDGSLNIGSLRGDASI